MSSFGGQSMVGDLRAVLLKRPAEAFRSQQHIAEQWRSLDYLAEPELAIASQQHEQLVTLLARHGAEIVYLPESDATGLDSLYAYDPAIICDRGVILCNMGKAARRNEPQAMGAFLADLGLPILGSIGGEGHLEAGDVVWLDERTVAVAEGYRTNAEGQRQLRALLGDAVDEFISVPLPHWTGPDACLHLMSLISLVDHDLAVVYSPLLPVPFRQLLVRRGIQLIEVPEAEYDSLGCNVLALAPRKVVALAGNPISKARMEDAGVKVDCYEGSEISLKGTGGPTCLTRPFWRGPVSKG